MIRDPIYKDTYDLSFVLRLFFFCKSGISLCPPQFVTVPSTPLWELWEYLDLRKTGQENVLNHQ